MVSQHPAKVSTGNGIPVQVRASALLPSWLNWYSTWPEPTQVGVIRHTGSNPVDGALLPFSITVVRETLTLGGTGSNPVRAVWRQIVIDLNHCNLSFLQAVRIFAVCIMIIIFLKK